MIDNYDHCLDSGIEEVFNACPGRDLPRLFGHGKWASIVVPLWFDLVLRQSVGQAIQDIDEIPQRGFCLEGVCLAASRLLAELRAEREALVAVKGRAPKSWHAYSSMLYLLLWYCRWWREPPPAELLWLTFEVLGLKEGNVPPEVRKGLGIGRVADFDGFVTAAQLDGKADASGRILSVKELARAMGRDRKTIRQWRGMEPYRAHRAEFADFYS